MFLQDDKPARYLRTEWSSGICVQAEKEAVRTFEYFHEYRRGKIGQ